MTSSPQTGMPAATTSSSPLPSLRLVDVACRRGDRVLFSGLDETLGAGELLWLRGGNGRGKTSLLRLVAGLAAPERGQILWGDAPTRRNERFDRQLVYIAHTNALKDDLTAAESLAFLARVHGRVHDANPSAPAIRAALARLGLAGRERTPTRSLSQGLRRRVALARLALETAPALWVLDEPFDALDVAGTATLHALLAAHRARGGSVLLTSHHLHLDVEAASAGFRVLDLDLLTRDAGAAA
ncbi:cytochrome c biogenesis heme-transporting ATPase CcmA [Scleromatobacter humisilvae]|uniref:Cytochrome c biogenesis heme-transporting ATPase CcmA n=1 Tax=Scleromatobacter humisilvae TaxID=2897159 RepID=A0A9X1YJU8_9BURK|nr:cytochrome c biogenesis heme-transporting ATPase CcmA [Scleromatobacter humisilvae]MCK9687659.1 cytochrome c biogenesis heme-transporting ATPase CcmA [Scleromatobacter humisilvae]